MPHIGGGASAQSWVVLHGPAIERLGVVHHGRRGHQCGRRSVRQKGLCVRLKGLRVHQHSYDRVLKEELSCSQSSFMFEGNPLHIMDVVRSSAAVGLSDNMVCSVRQQGLSVHHSPGSLMVGEGISVRGRLQSASHVSASPCALWSCPNDTQLAEGKRCNHDDD